jgi:hypothetical protein
MKLLFIQKYRNSFYISLLFAGFLTVSSSTWAQCGVSYSCAVPICTGACYASDAAKKKAEADGKCRAESKCESSVRQVKEELSKTPKTDPTYGFYRNQDCVASKSCADSSKLDSSPWLNNVVNDFIKPLINESGDWKKVKSSCEEPFVSKFECQKRMADYHIKTDLQNSVNKNGCGTEKDWDQVGVAVELCALKGIIDDVGEVASLPGFLIAKPILVSARKLVRDSCISYRKSHGLKIEE